MSASAAVAYTARKPTTEPACAKCGRGPLLPTEVASGRCPYCREGLAPAQPRIYTRCKFCTCALGLDDDSATGTCLDCATRPDVKRALARANSPLTQAPAPPAAAVSATSVPAASVQKRPFSPAEKSLIKHMHHILPPADLLRILNDRLVADLGHGTPLWTLEQLHAETSTLQQSERAADWAGLREILRVARSCGVLERITPQVIDDFAVVFGLSSAQVMNVRDVIRSAKEGA